VRHSPNPTIRSNRLFSTFRAALVFILTSVGLLAIASANGGFFDRLVPDHDWVGTWAASPQQASAFPVPGIPDARGFNNETVRHVVRISIGGDRLTVRLSNEHGVQPLVVGEVRVAFAGTGGAIVPGTDRQVTFGGTPAITIPVGAPALSDPVKLLVPDLASLAISVYLPNETGPATSHSAGFQTAYISPGNTTAEVSPVVASAETWRFFLSGVHVRPFLQAGAIVTFGDSITDGVNSTVDANKRWPDQLADRLAAAFGPMRLGVVNQGISGNRILHDIIGPSALARLDRDVLSVPGVSRVIVLEGINDIGYGVFFPTETVSAEDIIASHQQIMARLRSKGLKIYGATLLPFQGADFYTLEGETTRQAVNQWIRTSGAYDGVIDFDRVTRDPSQPMRLLPDYDSGDHLHPNDTGFTVMAEEAYQALFR
jgi:lysophospholipase L1-like esterase